MQTKWGGKDGHMRQRMTRGQDAGRGRCTNEVEGSRMGNNHADIRQQECRGISNDEGDGNGKFTLVMPSPLPPPHVANKCKCLQSTLQPARQHRPPPWAAGVHEQVRRPTAKMPVQQRQRRHCNDSKNTGTMMAKMPAVMMPAQ